MVLVPAHVALGQLFACGTNTRDKMCADVLRCTCYQTGVVDGSIRVCVIFGDFVLVVIGVSEFYCRRLVCAVALFAVVLALSACAGSGPSGRDLLSEGSHDTASFALVEITDENLDVVSVWHRPSFSAVYGDYRPPSLQKVDTGDTVQVNVWEMGGGLYASTSPQLAQGAQASAIPEQVVARDGTINVPYAGRFRVAGMTTQQVEQAIVKRLQRKAMQPQALVTLTRNISQSATVTGDVTTGARIPLTVKGDRILDVIATAGGIKAPVHEAFITLSRDGTSLTVPMQAILANMRENIYVRPADVITVFRQPQSFTAVGATGKNAVVGFEAAGITLEEAIAKAGGLIDDRSDARGVFILRYEPTELASGYADIPEHLLGRSFVPIAYRLNMKDPSSLFRARRFAMRDKDILYVSNAPLTEVGKIFKLVQMLTEPAIKATVVNRAHD